MSGAPQLRRTDKAIAPERAHAFLERDQIALYAIAVERMTGKEQPLPALAQQWPAVDRTKSPNADPATR
jgi:hypothetical protein